MQLVQQHLTYTQRHLQLQQQQQQQQQEMESQAAAEPPSGEQGGPAPGPAAETAAEPQQQLLPVPAVTAAPDHNPSQQQAPAASAGVRPCSLSGMAVSFDHRIPAEVRQELAAAVAAAGGCEVPGQPHLGCGANTVVAEPQHAAQWLQLLMHIVSPAWLRKACRQQQQGCEPQQQLMCLSPDVARALGRCGEQQAGHGVPQQHEDTSACAAAAAAAAAGNSGCSASSTAHCSRAGSPPKDTVAALNIPSSSTAAAAAQGPGDGSGSGSRACRTVLAWPGGLSVGGLGLCSVSAAAAEAGGAGRLQQQQPLLMPPGLLEGVVWSVDEDPRCDAALWLPALRGPPQQLPPLHLLRPSLSVDDEEAEAVILQGGACSITLLLPQDSSGLLGHAPVLVSPCQPCKGLTCSDVLQAIHSFYQQEVLLQQPRQLAAGSGAAGVGGSGCGGVEGAQEQEHVQGSCVAVRRLQLLGARLLLEGLCTTNQQCTNLAAVGVLGRYASPDFVECKAMRCMPKLGPQANITAVCDSSVDCRLGVCQRKQCVLQCATREQCVSSAKALGLSAAAATCESGRCVECSEATACPANAVFQDSRATCQSGRCVECAVDSDCARFQMPFGARPVCELNKCVECSDQRPCPLGLFGAQGACQEGRCIECGGTAQDACPAHAVKPGGACLAATAKCVQCTEDSHCGGKGPCGPDYSCPECKGDADCAAMPGVFPGAVATCRSGKCTECVADEDCGTFQYRFGPAPFCSSGRCVECSSGRPCPLGMHGAVGTCQDGRCKECGADADCPKKMLAPGGICQSSPGVPAFGKCVECQEAVHCKFLATPGKALVCAPEEGGCEECFSDRDCEGFAGVGGLGPYCHGRKCAVKGRRCSTAADCAYAGPCVGVAACPTPACVAGECESGLSGLDMVGLGV
ncbi:hypothetical protein COO60DRAFT_1699723 [Scenedesmus sp. NREL 46B-D3]|nr:hypothetical protein COO60DRAFT_1699723 [Scenedesmus sp. NREL 46B-D3]